MSQPFVELSLYKQRGLTLLESAIAAGLGAFVLFAVLNVYVTSRQTDTVVSEISKLQEAGRFAVEVMSEDIRLVGFLGMKDPNDLLGANAIVAANSPTSDYAATAIRGFEVLASNLNSWTNDAFFDDLKPGGAQPVFAGTDIISLQHADENGFATIGTMNNVAAPVVISGNPLGFSVGETMIVSSPESASIFRISKIVELPNNVQLFHETSHNTSTDLETNYTQGARVSRFETRTYYISDTGRTNTQGLPLFALYRHASDGVNSTIDEIMTGVENMQIIYGARDATGQLSYFRSGDIPEVADLVSVQISLLISSQETLRFEDDDNQYVMLDETVVPLGDGDGSDLTHPGDARLRKIFTHTVFMRNRDGAEV